MEYKELNVELTENDKKLLENYKRTLEDLGKYLGSSYEIVLHSLENTEESAIFVKNGFHTGRKIGAPITDLAVELLKKYKEEKVAESEIYFTKNRDNSPLKSTTIPITGEKGNIIALVCFNFYINTPLSTLISEWNPKEGEMKNELFKINIKDNVDYIKDTISQVKMVVYNDPSVFVNAKNKEIIRQLDEKGIFELKESVTLAADCLGISKNTVYMHIRNAK